MVCPVCGKRTTGKVGTDQFFCWECFVEFSVRGNVVQVYNIEADGTLSTIADKSYTGVGNLELRKG